MRIWADWRSETSEADATICFSDSMTALMYSICDWVVMVVCDCVMFMGKKGAEAPFGLLVEFFRDLILVNHLAEALFAKALTRCFPEVFLSHSQATSRADLSRVIAGCRLAGDDSPVKFAVAGFLNTADDCVSACEGEGADSEWFVHGRV
jgi:hypothetical protein